MIAGAPIAVVPVATISIGEEGEGITACVIIVSAFIPGMVKAQEFMPGALQTQQFMPGAVEYDSC